MDHAVEKLKALIELEDETQADLDAQINNARYSKAVSRERLRNYTSAIEKLTADGTVGEDAVEETPFMKLPILDIGLLEVLGPPGPRASDGTPYVTLTPGGPKSEDDVHRLILSSPAVSADDNWREALKVVATNMCLAECQDYIASSALVKGGGPVPRIEWHMRPVPHLWVDGANVLCTAVARLALVAASTPSMGRR